MPPAANQSKKAKFNVFVDADIERRFRQTADAYGGQLGRCLAAAMLQFIETDPKLQAELITRCFQAELHDAVGDLVEQAKAEQVRRIKQREAKER